MKIAVVTGGAHGIGKAIVQNLLESGNIVVAIDINRNNLDELKQGTTFENLHVLTCDVGIPDDVLSTVGVIGQKFGKIDYLVNNAGISQFEPIDEMSVETWNRILSVNLSSIFYMVKFTKHHFVENSSIVNIASTRAMMSEPNGEAYGASKGGIVALTHALAMSLASRTRVNSISPGWVEVNNYTALSEADHTQHPCRRVGKVEDIAEMVAYLLSEKSSFITGQNFVVDGGMTKKMIYV